jgi:hypothetical protein
MSRRIHTPSYRLHKSFGLAVVTLTDAATAHRKDVLLGKHNTKASRIEYARVLSEWLTPSPSARRSTGDALSAGR